ncbi:hypothetical protein LCGC14_1301660 [marine sediment metagenome]|uniref:Uncharacterized protein n=1 Tax=marine sediment metagenome TaxID=412755 RepID=A0A0F9KPS1_9ZZZZ
MTRILKEITDGANTLMLLILAAMAMTWLAAKDAVMIVAPILVWASGALLLIAALGIAYIFAERQITARAETRRDRTIANNQAILSDNEIVLDNLRTESEALLVRAAVIQIGRGRIFPTQLGDGLKFSAYPASIIRDAAAVPLLEAPPEALRFSDVAQKALSSRGAGRFIVFGSMDSGKTTLAKWTVQYAIQEIVRNQGGRVFIIDPHAPKVVWGDSLTVIGAGMDYRSIRAFLDHVKSDIKARYDAGCGDDSAPLPEPYKPNFIICEEWTGVIAELKSKKQWTDEDNRMLYMDSRKAGWGYLLVSHEHTVGALGLTGMGNLLAGVEYFITLEKDAITGEHSATLGNSFKDKNVYDLITPGAFSGRMYYSDAQAEDERSLTHKYLALAPPPPAEDESILGLDVEPEANEPEPDEDELSAIEAFVTIKNSPKFSWTKATKLAFGPGKFGANYTAKLCRILDKFDVDYSQQKVSK